MNFPCIWFFFVEISVTERVVAYCAYYDMKGFVRNFWYTNSKSLLPLFHRKTLEFWWKVWYINRVVAHYTFHNINRFSEICYISNIHWVHAFRAFCSPKYWKFVPNSSYIGQRYRHKQCFPKISCQCWPPENDGICVRKLWYPCLDKTMRNLL